MIARMWNRYVLPGLIERACKSHAILEERQRWVPEASGEVLEIGAGSGLNFAFYDAQRVRSVIGIDISAPLLARARPRAEAAAVPIELVEGDAQAMPFDRGRFDSVVVTYTLCSVPDLAKTLAEIRRVLRVGGALIFVEHGRAPDERTLRWQQRLTPVWRRIAGGCHLDRDIGGAVAAAGFDCSETTAAYTEGNARWLSFTYQGIAR